MGGIRLRNRSPIQFYGSFYWSSVQIKEVHREHGTVQWSSIGQVPAKYLGRFDDGDYFEFADKKFYYKLEFNFEDGTATLYDTCNRIMPMDYTNYEELSFSIGELAALQNAYQDLKDETEDFTSIVPAESYVREVLEETEPEYSCYLAADMASAAAQGFRDGRAYQV